MRILQLNLRTICKKCNKAHIGESGMKLADCFCEHLMDIHNETAKPGPLHFNSPNHLDETDISITILNSCFGDQIYSLSSLGKSPQLLFRYSHPNRNQHSAVLYYDYYYYCFSYKYYITTIIISFPFFILFLLQAYFSMHHSLLPFFTCISISQDLCIHRGSYDLCC